MTPATSLAEAKAQAEAVMDSARVESVCVAEVRSILSPWVVEVDLAWWVGKAKFAARDNLRKKGLR